MSANERSNTLTGTWKDGQIILDAPADWPDGCRVTVEPITGEVGVIGITEEQWTRTPEAIAGGLPWVDSIEPIEMTPEVEASLRAALDAHKAHEISKFEERARRIEGLFP